MFPSFSSFPQEDEQITIAIQEKCDFHVALEEGEFLPEKVAKKKKKQKDRKHKRLMDASPEPAFDFALDFHKDKRADTMNIQFGTIGNSAVPIYKRFRNAIIGHEKSVIKRYNSKKLFIQHVKEHDDNQEHIKYALIKDPYKIISEQKIDNEFDLGHDFIPVEDIEEVLNKDFDTKTSQDPIFQQKSAQLEILIQKVDVYYIRILVIIFLGLN
jgi:hypothetical protein